MNIKNLGSISVLSACLFTPLLSQAGSFEEAVNRANVEIDKASAVSHEWRDSRKLLETAENLYKEGKTDQAMQLVAQAKLEGELAIIQAEDQASVSGPRE